MHGNAASTRNELIHFGMKKRVASHLLGVGVLGLRFGNVLRKHATSKLILLLEPFGLGDIISFEPLVRLLKQRGFQVGICAKREWKTLYPEDEQLKWIDSQLPWGTHDEKRKYSVGGYRSAGFRKCLDELRHWANGAIGIDTRGDIRSVAVLHLAGCRRVLSLEAYIGSDLKVTPGTAELVPFNHRLHRWQLNLQFLGRIDPELRLEPTSGPRFEHLKKAPGGKRVGLIPAAPWAGKWWGKWRELVEALRSKHIETIGLCGPGQRTLAEQQLQAPLAVEECASIEAWVEALGKCAGIVCLDSGPMHLADALGVPLVALFGQGNLPLWAPSNPRSCVISHQGDPDFKLLQAVDENTSAAQKFMNRISVSEVIEAIEKVIAR